MTKSITQLGIDYNVTNPYENYGKLLATIFKQVKKTDKIYTWNEYITLSEVTLLPQFIPILKESEAYLKDLPFEGESNLNKSPKEIRTRTDLIVQTSAQFFDCYLTGEDVLRDVNYQWIDFAWEDCAGRVPRGCFRRDDRRAFLVGGDPDDRDDVCGVRSAARGVAFGPFNSSLLDPLATITLNGVEYVKKGENSSTEELVAIRKELMSLTNKVSGYLEKGDK